MQRFRIPLALLLGLGAAAASVLAGAEGQLETTSALRVTADLGVGERLSAAVIEEVQVDAAAVPRDYDVEVEQMLGRQVAVPIPAGALIHPEQLVGPGLLAGQDPGTVAVPVRPADPAMVALLTPGQRVDVLASSDTLERGSSSQLVATAAPVLWTPRDDSETWLPSGTEPGGVVILAVDPATAESIAEATQEGRLHLSLRGTVEPSGPADRQRGPPGVQLEELDEPELEAPAFEACAPDAALLAPAPEPDFSEELLELPDDPSALERFEESVPALDAARESVR